MKSKSAEQSSFSYKKILGLLTACFYILFTLAPDSHSLMVMYPFVSLWQIGLLLPVVWLLLSLWSRKIYYLGNGLDWLMGLIVMGVAICTVFAQFPHQALWYGWVVICFVAGVYLLNSYLRTSQLRYKLLVFQGYLSLAFVVMSLFLWITETLWPELERIAQLKAKGINLSFDFSVLELRNWAPLGHQNYVAGYLLLCLPLFVGLTIFTKGWRRWLWLGSCALGLVDLYTTSSKGGFLGLAITLIISLIFLLFFSSLPRLWLFMGVIGSLLLVSTLILANNRLLRTINRIFQGEGSRELVYRTINAVIGYRMGMSAPLTGVGLGGVPLLYQKYHPVWAGGESELAFQLHSTPVHLWAEMGIWSIIYGIAIIILLSAIAVKLLRKHNNITFSDRVFAWSILSSFLGYGIMSLTDYQLDNVCISGIMVLFLACLATIFAPTQTSPMNIKFKYFSLVGSGMAIAVMLWLIPVHRAWQLSSEGFIALANDDLSSFEENLTQANRIAPWEPYYGYQLGWNFGDLSRNLTAQKQKQHLAATAIKYFQQANTVSPYREFGHSNLAWLLLDFNPAAATTEFALSAKLAPTKRGVFFGLGLSLLAQEKLDLAVEAFSLEMLRDPSFLTSPVWRNPNLKGISPQILQNLEHTYDQWLAKEADNETWHRDRGGVYWWQGKIAAATKDWSKYGNNWQKILLDINAESKLKAKISQMPLSPTKLLLDAWFNPQQRQDLLQQAWLTQQQTPIKPEILEQLQLTMAQSPNLETWLRYNAPIFPYRVKIAGFGVLHRHIDGVNPFDFYVVMDNSAIATWFNQVYSYVRYQPELDQILQPRREQLLNNLS